MKISLVFATHNGATRIPLMFDALEKLDYPFDKLEIIAVDNNSTDSTVDILQSYQENLPLTILSEKTAGKSFAMNTGLDRVSLDTDLVILTDDDVIADPDWLNAYVRCADKCADYNIFGGEIRPYWEQEPKAWVLDWVNLSMVFAINEGTVRGEINPEMVFGPNSAFRSSIFTEDKVRFPTNVGPKSGGRYPMGNDTALAQLLAKQGHKAWQVEDAIVSHIIPMRNLDEMWILRRYERYGWGRVLLHPEWFQGYDGFSFAWLKKLIKFSMLCAVYYIARYAPRSHMRFNCLQSYYYEKGLIRGLLKGKSR